MAITQAVCTSFKQELLVGTHDFTATTGDTFKIALYTSSASLDATTTAYSSSNEVSNSGTYTATGTPRYWSWWDQNTIYLAPTPDSAYNVELGITRLPTRLSSSNTTSWLGNNAPALLLYGCLAEAFKFLKGPAEMLQLYEQSYQRALQELVIEQQGRHRRDEYMHGALRTPLQSQNP